jgi:hypothetical protein
MQWYIASRTKHVEKIKQITDVLTKQGEHVTSDWVNYGKLAPFEEHMDEVAKLTSDVVASILASDIFVLISDQEGTDMFVELGIALARKSEKPENRIYIVGPYAKRSLMQLHQGIIHVGTIDEVLKKEGISFDLLPTFSFD